LCGIVTFGYLSDHFLTRRLPFTLGLTLLGSSTILFALAPSLPFILVARALQGCASAVVFTVGYALLVDKVGSEQLGQAMGYTSMALSLGWFLGPVVGGVVYKKWGYFAVFALPLGLVGVEIVLRVLIVEEKKERQKGIVEDGETQPLLLRPDEHTPSVQRNAFVVLIRSPRFLVGMFAFSVLNGLMIAMDGVLPVYIKELFGFNSEQVSLVFLALTMPTLLSPLFGEWSDRLGSTKWPAMAGLTLSIPALLLLSMVREDTKKDLVVLVILLVVLGLSFAIGLPPLAAEVMHVVEEIEERNPGIFGPHGATGQAYGLTNAGLGLGCAIGPLAAGFVRVEYGWAVAVTCMAVVSAVTIIPVLPITGGSLWREKVRNLREEVGTEQHES
jgi:MFS family permease